MQRHKIAFTICLGLAVTLFSSAALAQYQLTNLDSNQAKTAKFMDPLQVNGWGLARSSGSPFWVSDQGSGWSTIYNGKGVKQGLEVLIPSATGAGPGQPTGIVVNGSSDFQIGGQASHFLFATLDGTISGWAPGANPNDAIIVVNNSASGAVLHRSRHYQPAFGEPSVCRRPGQQRSRRVRRKLQPRQFVYR